MLAANFESLLIFLLIAGASAFFNWMKKRGETAEDWTESEIPPPPRTQDRNSPAKPTTRKTTNWEEELRRMLEGTVPSTRTPAPPPIVTQKRESPAPILRPPAERSEPKASMALPKVFTEERFYKAHCNYCDGHIEFPATAMDEVISCPHCARSTVLRPFENTRVEKLAHQRALANLATSNRKYEEASQLSQRVAAHMHGVGHKPVGLTSIETTKTIWPEIAETKALFKNARTVRQAVIASLILGPPKALEN